MLYDRLQKVKTITESENVDMNFYTYKIDPTSSEITVILPAVETVEGLAINFIPLNLANPVNISWKNSENIYVYDEVFTTFTFTNAGDSLTLQSDGTNWMMI